MKRKCFLCDNDKLTVLINQWWDLPGFESKEIGFAICPTCGLILQTPSLDPIDMYTYYKETAVYINPGRNGKPTLNKERDVKRQLNIITDVTGTVPNSVFQIGCSDGYTLSRFRNAGVSIVEGIDPNIESCKLAKELYNIETTVGIFEEYNPRYKYDLLILTHILEHLYNPKEIMFKCYNMLKNKGWVLIEVPLFERMDKLPPGVFSLEHLNYFSELTLLRLLSLTEYTPYLIEKLYYNNIYPVITVLARKEKWRYHEWNSDFKRAYSILVDYLKKDKENWQHIEIKIKKQLKKGTSVYIWGAGIHTSQLFANTDLKEYLHIKGIIDSSPTKWKKNFGNLKCYSPSSVNIKKGDVIIISSYASEQEIYEGLKKYQDKGVDLIRLYGEG